MMCVITKHTANTLFNFDNELYLKELEIMRQNKDKLLKSLNKGEKKLCKLFKNDNNDNNRTSIKKIR